MNLLNWSFDFSSPNILVSALTILVVAVAYYYRKVSRLPPGPTGVPFLGYWPFLDAKDAHLQLDALKKKYGDVFSLNVTGALFIHLGSLRAIREAHVTHSDCFTTRGDHYSLFSLVFGGGLVFLPLEEWKVIRKFFMQSVKDRVAASIKDLMSGSLYDSVQSTVDELTTKRGETFNIVEFLTDKCSTNMRLTLFGESGISQQSVLELNQCYGIMMSTFTSTNMLANGNIARFFIFPFMPGFKECMDNLRKAEQILYRIIDEHKSTYDEDHMRDVIDEYLREKNTRLAKGDPTARFFTDRALMSSLIQILGDGVLSVAAFIAMFIKSAVDHPDEQDKIFRELVEVVGADRQTTIEDKSKLTFTNAFILESLRTSDFFPVFPSMRCTKETTLNGYRIPKGAVTVMNTYSAHNDPETYENPQKFDPSRYIVTEGKKKPEPLATFGMGKRACIGESFTMIQVFLFVTALIKNFRISLPKGLNDNSADLLTDGILRIIVEPRQ